MTFEKVLKRNRLISDYLSQVASRKELLGWDDAVRPPDSYFRDVLAAQERLLIVTERLLDNCAQRVAQKTAKAVAVSKAANASFVTPAAISA